MEQNRATRLRALALIALVPLCAPAVGEAPVAFALRLQPLESLPSERWAIEVEAGPGIASVRFAIDGGEAELDRTGPFKATLRLAQPFARPVWIEAIGLDEQGRELARDGRYAHRPEDLEALRLVRVGDREAVVLVEPAAGRRVVRVEGIRPDGSVFASAEAAPFRFSPPREGAWAARATFDDGSAAAAWDPGTSSGELVEVRLGQARWLAPSEAPPLALESVQVLFRGRPQRVLRLLGGGTTSLELGIAVDVSESSGPRFEELRAASRELAASLVGSGDRSFLVTFSQQAQLVASARGDLDRVLGAVPAEVRSDKTRVYDGLAYSLLQFHTEDPRAALIVLTDACDTTKRPDVERVRELARARAIPIYALLLEQDCVRFVRRQDLFENLRRTPVPDRTLTHRNRARLEKLARETGGRVVLLADGDSVEGALQVLLKELERQWLVVFEPSSESVSSAEVEVRVTDPPR